MKQFTILYADTVDVKALAKLDKPLRDLIQKQIEIKLSVVPERCKPLKKSLKGYRRLRIGHYRVLFKIEEDRVKIVFIGKKPEVYEKFMKKIS